MPGIAGPPSLGVLITRKTAGEDAAILRTRDLCSVQDLEKESWESLGIEVRNKNTPQKNGDKKTSSTLQ